MRNNRIIATIYRLGFAILGLVGLLLNTKMFTAEFNVTSLLYYTTQSNFLAILLLIYLGVKTIIDLKRNGVKGSSSYAPNLTFIMMIDIVLTFVVFWVVLAPVMIGTSFNLFSFSNLSVHTFIPLAIVGDYFIFNKDKKISLRHANYVLIYPLFYSSCAFVLGAFKVLKYYTFDIPMEPSYFPYFFMDFYVYGWYVILFVLGIASFLFTISHLSYYYIHKHQVKTLNKES